MVDTVSCLPFHTNNLFCLPTLIYWNFQSIWLKIYWKIFIEKLENIYWKIGKYLLKNWKIYIEKLENIYWKKFIEKYWLQRTLKLGIMSTEGPLTRLLIQRPRDESRAALRGPMAVLVSMRCLYRQPASSSRFWASCLEWLTRQVACQNATT